MSKRRPLLPQEDTEDAFFEQLFADLDKPTVKRACTCIICARNKHCDSLRHILRNYVTSPDQFSPAAFPALREKASTCPHYLL